jgi:hypothetical protein
MRYLSRLHGCAATVILIVLYFFYQERALGFGSTMRGDGWHETTHRIVVFGDEWSDTGSNRVSTHLQLLDSVQDPGEGELWTETLCKEVRPSFDHRSNN